ncbi:MAG: hypothetical protein EZS28_008470 [Streblomastix strix]|uniref:Uncharacterized protein n=1 Tax=Streblomastix strix TaxID=222440 RepID=A0A5J4WLZ6_9EUKA|nr:MAG: hypothetical protein EZS28_008470 [Streblomastix strix]
MINEYDTLLGKKKGDETEIPVSEEISNKNRIISFKAKLAHIIRKVIGDNNQQVIDVKGKDEINEEVQQIESEKIEQENKNDNDKQKIRKELNEIMECLFGVNSLDDLNDEKDKDENEVLNSSEKEDSSEDGETEVCARCGALDLGGFCDCGTYDYLDAEDQMADMLLQEQVNQSLNDQTQAANNSEQFEVKLKEEVTRWTQIFCREEKNNERIR